MRKLREKEDVMKLALRIQNNAHQNKLKIKRVLLGSHARTNMNDRSLASDLSNMISSNHLRKRLRNLKRKIKKQRKKEKKKTFKPIDPQTLLKMQNGTLGNPQNPPNYNRSYNTSSRQLTVGAPSSSSSSGAAKGGDDMKFNFQPGYAGMPFPPFMMNGPHFHPPLNITVNSLPNPNPRAQMHPSVIEETNLKEDQDMLQPILEKLGDIKTNLEDLSRNANVNLQDKYSILLNQMA